MFRKWRDLSPRVQRLIITAGAVETVLKVAGLIDLKRRTPLEVRGPRTAWAASMALNTGGLLPLTYFAIGRLPKTTSHQ